MERIVYKYLGPNRLHVLESGLIRFTQAAALNDPFECTPRMHLVRQNLWDIARPHINTLSGMAKVEVTLRTSLSIRDRLKKFNFESSNNFGILSLSETNNNLLMWSHYCDSHRGFAVGFDSQHAFFRSRKFRAFSALAPVKYSADRPIMPRIDEASMETAEIMFFTKSEDWAYEQEVRKIANVEAADETKHMDGSNMYFFRFPPDSVREIIFGYRVSEELKDRCLEVIREEYSEAEIFTAVISDEKFDLDIRPFHSAFKKEKGPELMSGPDVF